MTVTKACRKCREEKSVDDFNRNYLGRHGRQGACRKCERQYGRAYYIKNREKRIAYQKDYAKRNPKRMAENMRRSRHRMSPDELKDRRLSWAFSISLVDYRALLSLQGGACAGCQKPEASVDKRTRRPRELAVDHDRSCCPGVKSCGKCVRGLLCGRCNRAVGLLRDDPEIMVRLSEYLKAAVR